jgi:hypothetical protein
MPSPPLKKRLSSGQLCCDLGLHKKARPTKPQQTCSWDPKSHNVSPDVWFQHSLEKPQDPDMRFEGLAGFKEPVPPALSTHRYKVVHGPVSTPVARAGHCHVLRTTNTLGFKPGLEPSHGSSIPSCHKSRSARPACTPQHPTADRHSWRTHTKAGQPALSLQARTDTPFTIRVPCKTAANRATPSG